MPTQDEDEIGDGESTTVTSVAPHDADTDGELPNSIKRWQSVMGPRAPGVYQISEEGIVQSQIPGDEDQALAIARAVLAGEQTLPADPQVDALLRELMQQEGQRRHLQRPVGFGHDVPNSGDS